MAKGVVFSRFFVFSGLKRVLTQKYFIFKYIVSIQAVSYTVVVEVRLLFIVSKVTLFYTQFCKKPNMLRMIQVLFSAISFPFFFSVISYFKVSASVMGLSVKLILLNYFKQLVTFKW